jgi:RimJ/RimL family protein N-acetyltransferase
VKAVLVAETARLLIREFESGDTPALAKILGDPSVMEFSSKGALTEADTAKFIEWCGCSYQEHGYGQWALLEKTSGALIGFCGLSHAAVDGVDEVEIAYRLAQDQWGKGLAPEAASRVLEHGFSIRKIESIVGIVSPRHESSIRVLEKVGFEAFSETRYSGWDVRVYRLCKLERKPYNYRSTRPP